MNRYLRLITLAVLAGTGMAAAVWWSRPRAAPEITFQKGLMAAHQDDWTMVDACVQELQRESGFQAQRRLLLGLRLVAHGEIRRGLANLYAASTHKETRIDAFAAAGRTYYLTRQYSAAIPLLHQVLQWAPEHDEACRFLASAYYDIGAMQDALLTLDRLAQIAPHDHLTYRLRGLILRDMEQFESASDQFRMATECLPPDSAAVPRTRSDWARCLVRERKYEEALEVLQAIPDRDRAEPAVQADILASLAAACFHLRRIDEARAASDQALRISSQHTEAVLTAARIAEEEGDLDSALASLQQAIEAAPFEPQLHTRLADLLVQLNRPDEALPHRERSAALVETRATFADLHQQAINQPRDALIRLRLAELAEQMNRPELARMWLEAAAGMEPGNPDIRAAMIRFQQSFPGDRRHP